MQWEAIQQIKDFTAEWAYDEAEFYMGMVAEAKQAFYGHIETSEKCFSVWRDFEWTDQ